MSSQETKTEIHKVVDQLPDDISDDVLRYLQGLLNKSSRDLSIASSLSKIISDDGELLKRLAQ